MRDTPKIAGEFMHIYRPGGDTFLGPDRDDVPAGRWYADWVPNDHTFVKGPTGTWHGFGITGPASPTRSHGPEWQSFHIESHAATLTEAVTEGLWTEHPKVLTPATRPGERNELWGPFVLEKAGLYYMFYGPTEVRLATSHDLFAWEPRGTLFKHHTTARDISVMRHEDGYYMFYVMGPSIYGRTSRDLLQWSKPAVEVFTLSRDGHPESPCVVEHGGSFFLFWCLWDGTQGPYDTRTHVFRSSDPLDFHGAEQTAELQAHAPEVVRDETGNWYVSSAEWPRRGVSAARLEWQ